MKMKTHPIQQKRVHQLRRHQTKAEQKLWAHLRAHQIDGVKFRRQQPIGPFIVDFCSKEHRLVIELDGGHHMTQVDEDRSRSSFLQREGFSIIRFWNSEVLGNIDGVIAQIEQVLRQQ